MRACGKRTHARSIFHSTILYLCVHNCGCVYASGKRAHSDGSVSKIICGRRVRAMRHPSCHGNASFRLQITMEIWPGRTVRTHYNNHVNGRFAGQTMRASVSRQGFEGFAHLGSSLCERRFGEMIAIFLNKIILNEIILNTIFQIV